MDSVDRLQVDMTHVYRRPALVKDYDYGQFFFDLRSRVDKMRQDLIDHLRQTPGMHQNAARTASRRQRHLPTCVFCRKNNEVTMLVHSHEVKDGADIATCPMLRQFVCAICGASGDTAHTLKYCPLAHTVPFGVMVMLRHLTDKVNERHKQQRYQAQQQQRQHSQQQQRQHSRQPHYSQQQNQQLQHSQQRRHNSYQNPRGQGAPHSLHH